MIDLLVIALWETRYDCCFFFIDALIIGKHKQIKMDLKKSGNIVANFFKI